MYKYAPHYAQAWCCSTSSMTAVVQEVSSLMPWWPISVSSLEVWSFSEKLLLVIIYRGEGEGEGGGDEKVKFTGGEDNHTSIYYNTSPPQ